MPPKDDSVIVQSEKFEGKRIYNPHDEVIQQSLIKGGPTAQVGNLYDISPDRKNRPNQRYSLEQTRFLNRIKHAS